MRVIIPSFRSLRCGRALCIFHRDGPFWLVAQQKTKEQEEWEKEGKGRVSGRKKSNGCRANTIATFFGTELRDGVMQIALPFERQAIRRHNIRQRG